MVIYQEIQEIHTSQTEWSESIDEKGSLQWHNTTTIFHLSCQQLRAVQLKTMPCICHQAKEPDLPMRAVTGKGTLSILTTLLLGRLMGPSGTGYDRRPGCRQLHP